MISQDETLFSTIVHHLVCIHNYPWITKDKECCQAVQHSTSKHNRRCKHTLHVHAQRSPVGVFTDGYRPAQVIQHCSAYDEGLGDAALLEFRFCSDACMAEYVAHGGRGGAAGIAVALTLCIVLSRLLSSTTFDTSSAFTSLKTRLLPLCFCETCHSSRIFWIRCL